MRSKHSSAVAVNSAFLFAKSRKRYGCETPTRAAMLSVDVPCRPPLANSSRATFTTAVRRSPALIRMVPALEVMGCKLLLNNLGVKGDEESRPEDTFSAG